MTAPAINAPESNCPKCGYALTGLSGRVCPECGVEVTPELLARALRRRRRKRWVRSMLLVAVIMYAPHAWLLFIDYPWSEHRWFWLTLWPLLPGLPWVLVERFAIGWRLPEWLGLVVMGAFAGGQLLLLSWLASRGRKWMIAIAIVLIPLSIWLGIVSHALFQL